MAGASGKKNPGRVRKLDGKLVTPVLCKYGRGKYMSGMVDGSVVHDEQGRPIPLMRIGELE